MLQRHPSLGEQFDTLLQRFGRYRQAYYHAAVCHAGGRGFEPVTRAIFIKIISGFFRVRSVLLANAIVE